MKFKAVVLPALLSSVALAGCLTTDGDQGMGPDESDKSTLSLVFNEGGVGATTGEGDCQSVTAFVDVRWSTEPQVRMEAGIHLLDAWFNYVDLGVYDKGQVTASGYWDRDECATMAEIGGAFATYAAYTTWPERAFTQAHQQLTTQIAARLANPQWSQPNELPEINSWIESSACVLARQTLLATWANLLKNTFYLQLVREDLGFDLSAANTPSIEAAMPCPDLKAPLTWSPRA